MLKEFKKKWEELEEERSKLVSFMDSEIEYWERKKEDIENLSDDPLNRTLLEILDNLIGTMVDDKGNIARGVRIDFIEKQFEEFEGCKCVLKKLFEEKDSV